MSLAGSVGRRSDLSRLARKKMLWPTSFIAGSRSPRSGRHEVHDEDTDLSGRASGVEALLGQESASSKSLLNLGGAWPRSGDVRRGQRNLPALTKFWSVKARGSGNSKVNLSRVMVGELDRLLDPSWQATCLRRVVKADRTFAETKLRRTPTRRLFFFFLPGFLTIRSSSTDRACDNGSKLEGCKAMRTENVGKEGKGQTRREDGTASTVLLSSSPKRSFTSTDNRRQRPSDRPLKECL